MARLAAALASVIMGCTVLGIASGCAPPEHTYVANSANHTYFKVPASWHEIDQSALQQTTTGASPTPQSNGEWAIAYDAADVPSPAHLLASNTLAPIVYVSVQPLPMEASGQVSLDNLRDLVLPVTTTARAAAAATSTTFSDFSLVSDSELTPKSGLRGVRDVFQYRVDGGLLQTFDQTAYTNKDGSKVYVMLLRCSSKCYQARRSELESVVASFTVQEG